MHANMCLQKKLDFRNLESCTVISLLQWNLARDIPMALAYSRWRGGLVVGRRTYDLVVAGSRPSRDAAA